MISRLASALVGVLICGLLSAAPARAAILLEQPVTGALGEQMTQDMTDYPDSSIYAFDDFTIAGGSWTVSRVTAYVYDYSGNDAAIEDIRLTFTDTAVRDPSLAGWVGRLVRPSGVPSMLVFDLPNVVLSPGKHWLSVWVKGPYDGTDPDMDGNCNVIVQVCWRLTTPVRGSEFYFDQPGGGWGYGTGSLPGSTIYGNAADLAFRIEGTTSCPPQVVACYPKGNSASRSASPKITFDMPMVRRTTETAVSSVPAIPGTFSWKGTALILRPSAPLMAGMNYRVKVSTKAKSSTGRNLVRAFGWRFKTAGTAAPLLLTAAATPLASGREQFTVNLTGAATVRARLTNLAGRVVAVLPPRELPEGVSALAWNGRGGALYGTRVPPGRYLLRLEATTPDGRRATCLVSWRH